MRWLNVYIFNSLIDWTHAVIKIILTLYRIVDVVVILKIKRLACKVFCLAQVQLSTRESIRVYHVSKFPLSSEKIETLLVVVVFLVSLAHKNKTVKLKKHKHKKSNICRISVKERKREKIYRKELPTFNSQFTIKRTIEIVHAFPGILSFPRTSHASKTTKTPEKE